MNQMKIASLNRMFPPLGIGKCSTCSEECFSLARLNLIRQSCVVLRETFVQLGKSFRGGATTPWEFTKNVLKFTLIRLPFLKRPVFKLFSFPPPGQLLL